MRPANSPRCYGLATMFGADAAICGICRHHDDCGVAAKTALAALAEKIEVGNTSTMHVCTKSQKVVEGIYKSEQFTVDKAHKAFAGISPKSTKKVDKLVSQILKAEPDARAHFIAGINPLDASFRTPFVKPLIDILFSREPSPERMIELMVTVFSKSEKEAKAQIALLLSAIDVIKTNEEAP